jgi:eukaryotic-like serine/threonine-protein kinase
MEEVREGRHLAAIMFMDMVGYSARMQDNEQRAIAAVRGLWELVRPLLGQHGGREVDLAGDGMLTEFPGALAAVRCGLAVHAALAEQNAGRAEAERIRVRCGVHIGDIEHRDGRIYGDGVNIAARVIGLAPPGAIAMTAHVRDQLMNALEQPVQRLGLRALKNIKAPLELWCVAGPECTGAELAAAKGDDVGADRKWSFGPCVLDERTLELTVAGQPVSLDKHALDVLLHLLSHAGEVVTKEELLEAVWPASAGTEAALAACLARLQAAFGAGQPDIVKTVHGFGYRLAVPVSVETATGEAAPHFDFQPGTRPPLRPQWSLVERLGSGGHGEAWLARHDKTKELRVFKFALEAAALASLKRETTLYRVLKEGLGPRPDYVHILDWNFDQAPYFIESEHANQGNLAQWAERRGLAAMPLAERVELVAQIADALAAAHSVGVLHKDLKPTNVLMHEEQGRRQLKLCDFGSGGVVDTKRLEQLGITRMGFTKTVFDVSDGTTSGTPLYLAPEVVAGQPFTVQADIFALGVMLYQMVVGDFKRGLAPGWERNVADELLRDDIAAAADGHPSNRLPDPSLLAKRLRSLEERRVERAQQRERTVQAERTKHKLQRARVRDRVALLVAGVLLLAAFPIAKYYMDAMRARRDAEAVATFLADEVLSMADPNVGKTDDLSFKAVIERAAERVDRKLADQPVAAARVHLALSNSLQWFDLDKEALKHSRRAAALYEQVYGRNSEETQGVLVNMVWDLRANGFHEEGTAISNEVIDFATRHWGAQDLRTLNVLFNMATIQRSMGHVAEPVAGLRAVIDAASGLPEESHDPWWYFQYGVALSAAGEYAEAEKVFARCIAMNSRKPGADYALAWAQHNHANVLTNLGRYDEAEKEIRQSFDRMAAWKGVDDKQSIIFHARIGEFLLDAGRPQEALPILEADLARCRRRGCDASDSVSMRQSLSEAYVDAGKPQAAIVLLEEVVEGLRGEHIWANRRLDRVRLALAEAQLAAGRVAEAQASLEEIPEYNLRTLPPKHPMLAAYRRVQGLLALKQGQPEKARAALAEADDIYRLRFAHDHYYVRRVREDLLRAEKAKT